MMKNQFDLSKTIAQLEGNWEEPLSFPTSLVEKVYKYRKIPLSNLSVEQLRLLIGQEEGLCYLIPVALEILKRNILAEGDLYEGDLLNAVLSVNGSFWNDNPNLKKQVQELIFARHDEIGPKANRQLLRKIEAFRLNAHN